MLEGVGVWPDSGLAGDWRSGVVTGVITGAASRRSVAQRLERRESPQRSALQPSAGSPLSVSPSRLLGVIRYD